MLLEIAYYVVSCIVVGVAVKYFVDALVVAKLKDQQPLDDFVVKNPKPYNIVFTIATLFFAFCSYFASTSDDEMNRKMGLVFLIVAIEFVILLIISNFNKVQYHNGKLKVTQLAPPLFCTFNFQHDIKRMGYTSDESNSIILFTNRGKIFIDGGSLGYENIKQLCEKYHIPTVDHATKQGIIQKRNLLFPDTIKYSSIIFACILLPFVIVPATSVIDAITTFLILYVPIMLILAIIPFTCLPQLRHLESDYNFDFNAEMRKEMVAAPGYKNWYIAQDSLYFFVIRRDFIKSISKIHKDGDKRYIDIETTTGRKIRTKVSINHLREFVKWYQEKLL